jgi:hypothetical protein
MSTGSSRSDASRSDSDPTHVQTPHLHPHSDGPHRKIHPELLELARRDGKATNLTEAECPHQDGQEHAYAGLEREQDLR